MHQADRYFLEVYGLAEVGRYTLAYTLVYALAMLVITSFSSIWVVKRYELADLPSAERTFARVFEQHMQTFFVAVLGLSLFAPLAIRILANPNYLSAVPVIPVLSLGYAMYAARVHFESPIHIARRTWSTVPVQVAAVVVCLLLNGLLIPPFGMLGAAWATVLTFATFAAGYYYVAQRIRPIAWPLREVALFGAVCVAGYLLVQLLGAWLGPPGYYTSATLVWLAAAAYVARDAITALRPGNAEEVAGTPVEATTAEPA
jgi:O-antigen/teichoic acid export membrane protein